MYYSKNTTRCKKKVIKHNFKLGQRRCPFTGLQLIYNRVETGILMQNSATIEHIIPKSKGGTSHSTNVMTISHVANNKRGNTCWIKWIESFNPPKKDYLIERYLEAVLWHMLTQSEKLRISTGTIRNYIERVQAERELTTVERLLLNRINGVYLTGEKRKEVELFVKEWDDQLTKKFKELEGAV